MLWLPMFYRLTLSKMPNKKWKQHEKAGRPHTYLLKVKLKGHTTWRVLIQNRDLDRVIDEIGKQNAIEAWEIEQMDGFTGKMTVMKK